MDAHCIIFVCKDKCKDFKNRTPQDEVSISC